MTASTRSRLARGRETCASARRLAGAANVRGATSGVRAALGPPLEQEDEAPGYTCFGGPGFGGGGWLGAWAPGGTGYDYPDGTGIPVVPGSKIVVQLHYNSLTAGPQPDQTTIQMKIDESVEHEAVIQPWTNPFWLAGDAMSIPAASKDVTHAFTQDPTQWFTGGASMIVHSPMLHMHELGKSARLSSAATGARRACSTCGFYYTLAP